MAFMHQFGRSKSVVKRSKKYLEEALYKRLFKEGSSELSIRQQLNQFLKTKKRVYKWEVDDSLKILRRRNRYYPALKKFRVPRIEPPVTTWIERETANFGLEQSLKTATN